jgi:hypothetical protein
MRLRIWLRHCVTSQKVTGSITDGVIEIFHSRNPSGHTTVNWASELRGTAKLNTFMCRLL